MEQYANDRGPSWRVKGAKPPEDKTLLAFGRSMEAANLPAFKYLETKKFHVCSLHDPGSFSDFSKIIFFPDLCLTFPDLTNSLTFPVFPDL